MKQKDVLILAAAGIAAYLILTGKVKVPGLPAPSGSGSGTSSTSYSADDYYRDGA